MLLAAVENTTQVQVLGAGSDMLQVKKIKWVLKCCFILSGNYKLFLRAKTTQVETYMATFIVSYLNYGP